MTSLSVNLNAVAQLRNRRDLPWPSVTGIGEICLEAGAEGLTVHPRPDERHIRRTDVFELKALLEDWPDREFNIEGYPSEDFLVLCEQAAPQQVTLVPDDPSQATSDHGWDVARNRDLLIPAVKRLSAGGMRVSLFVDADPLVPQAVAEVGAHRIELFTGPYGHPGGDYRAELARLARTADAARTAGHNVAAGRVLGINAGHDLTLNNLAALKAAIPDLDECSIGHALTADALIYGFAEAVRKYRAILGGRL
ncbi:MAG: pyridoxine 5'-phosphate synthase [Devosia sp.]